MAVPAIAIKLWLGFKCQKLRIAVTITNKEGKPLVLNSVWKVTIPEQGSADIEFCDGAGLLVLPNNSGVIQFPIPVLPA
jgi:hypothetical protein